MRRDDEGAYHEGNRFVTRSGREPYDSPAIAHPVVAQPVVEAIRAALPILEHGRYDAVSAPVRWPCHRLTTLGKPCDSLLQPGATRHGLALGRGHRTHLAAKGPGGEVGVRLLAG